MVINVVPMTLAHAGCIAKLEQLCFAEPLSYNAIRALLLTDTAYSLVATICFDFAGYASMICVLDSAYITNIAVFPQFRRCNVATSLIHALICFCYDNGIIEICLEVRVSNVAAISLYEQCGFVNAGLRPNMYHLPDEDGFVMRRCLQGI